MPRPSRLQKSLKLNYNETDNIWLQEQKTLRILVGFLGILLPLMLWLFLFICNGCYSPMESISHYYYTRVGSIFVIVMSLLAIFLLVYKGMEPIDFYLSSIAGIFALFVVLFPTNNISSLPGFTASDVAVTRLPESNFRTGFHLLSAAIFLGCLAYMSLFIFTKSDTEAKNRDRNKKIRNRIYRTCGVIMVVALLVIVARRFGFINETFFESHKLTFWMETVAVFFFGISWLTRAEVVLKNKHVANAKS